MKFIAILLLIMMAGLGFAHPPSEIKAKIDLNERTLEVEIGHSVKSSDHYIHQVEIALNGKLIIRQDSVVQYNESIQKYVYFIPELKENDKISITGKCNKFGSLKREFVAEKKE
ncbi:MAG: hypothetical protein ACP5QT_05185 [Brevinematia bacterium]